jgi:hypothetical protein
MERPFSVRRGEEVIGKTLRGEGIGTMLRGEKERKKDMDFKKKKKNRDGKVGGAVGKR